MSVSKLPFHTVGFSTGALERGNFKRAIGWLIEHEVPAVELSALRFNELEPLIGTLDKLDLAAFEYISFHAPSSFRSEEEAEVVSMLHEVYEREWNIVIHPDVIYSPNLYRDFGSLLLIENMDKRKSTGRTVEELESFFIDLPEARFCLDLAHARDADPTLTLIGNLLYSFRDRLAELHISELDSLSHHVPLSNWAISDYRRFADQIPPRVPVIIESLLEENLESDRLEEMGLVRKLVSHVVWEAEGGMDEITAAIG